MTELSCWPPAWPASAWRTNRLHVPRPGTPLEGEGRSAKRSPQESGSKETRSIVQAQCRGKEPTLVVARDDILAAVDSSVGAATSSSPLALLFPFISFLSPSSSLSLISRSSLPSDSTSIHTPESSDSSDESDSRSQPSQAASSPSSSAPDSTPSSSRSFLRWSSRSCIEHQRIKRP